MKLKIVLFIVLNWVITFSLLGQDPGLPGLLGTSSQVYDFGDEVWTHQTLESAVEIRGVVHYPTNLLENDYPVLMFLHGRHAPCYSDSTGLYFGWPCNEGEEIPSYLGYDFLASQMASHGYIVISIGSNGVNALEGTSPDFGMSARADLIQTHLNLWDEWNTSDVGPFGNQFVGKLDLQRVGTMGHSRGGEGIMIHTLINEQQGSPYRIEAALAVAPTNLFRVRPVNTNIGVMLGYCDGDVADLQGVHYYDDSRYEQVNSSYSRNEVLLMGANHNYFNLNWSDGQFGGDDDWGLLDAQQLDEHCGFNNNNNNRLTPEEQRAAFVTYASAFFRKYVGGENDFDAILMTEELSPPSSSGLNDTDVFVSYHPSLDNALLINTGQEEENTAINDLLDTVKNQSLINHEICGANLFNRFCANAFQAQQPHSNSFLQYELGLSQIHLQWDENTDWYENELSTYTNISEYESLQFRAAVDFTNLAPNTDLDFGIVLIDGNGNEQQLNVGTYSNALFFPPGNFQYFLPKLVQNTISIPLADFNLVDLNNIVSIRFAFNQNAEGAVLISDVMLTGSSIAALPPLADFESNILYTCTGFVSFIDQSKYVPTSWTWDFGDGSGSDLQNPSHFYAESGIYTVTLITSNDNGSSTRERVEYIVVEKPIAPSVSNDYRCTPGVVELEATSNFDGELVWFDTLGAPPVNIGESFQSNIVETTNYYVQEVVPAVTDTAGISTIGDGDVLNFNVKTIFDVHKNCTLKSVRIEAATDEFRAIGLYDENGILLDVRTFTPAVGPETVSLNFSLVSGGTYALGILTPQINLYTDSLANYPYHAGDLATLVGIDAGLSRYFYFYDWIFESENCFSELSEVSGVIEDVDLNPILVQNANELEVTNLDVENVSEYQWLLNGDTIAEATGSVYTFTEDGTYTVIVTDVGGCTGSDDFEVVSTNVHETKNEKSIIFYPNPVSDKINMKGLSHERGMVKIYNALGELIVEKEILRNTSINVESLNAGSYYIHVFLDDGSSIMKKIIKL